MNCPIISFTVSGTVNSVTKHINYKEFSKRDWYLVCHSVTALNLPSKKKDLCVTISSNFCNNLIKGNSDVSTPLEHQILKTVLLKTNSNNNYFINYDILEYHKVTHLSPILEFKIHPISEPIIIPKNCIIIIHCSFYSF